MNYLFKGNYIWDEDQTVKNSWLMFTKSINLSKKIKYAGIKIAVDSVYYLYINNKMVLSTGGLNRGPYPNAGYYDEVKIQKHLVVGENNIQILVWYYGNQGRNSIDSGKGYLCMDLDIDGRVIGSDDTFLVKRQQRYIETEKPYPTYLYAGHNIGYDAAIDIENIPYKKATIYHMDHNSLVKRPIPLFKDYGVLKYQSIEKTIKDDYIVYTCKLPYGCQVTPLFDVSADSEHELISIKTDRYITTGGPGDEHHQYRGHRVDYYTKKRRQEFEALNWFYGEQVIYTIPADITVHSLSYRESGYDCQLTGSFNCDDELLNQLYKKSQRTLYACMRDNYMDCPDRERGQWIGDVSSQIPQVFYSLSREADLLTKKAINDFLQFKKGDILRGNVPGANSSELVTQSLNAISPIGMIMSYYENTADIDIIKKAYEPCLRYLMLWEFNEVDELVSRKGNWYWCDHGRNVDCEIIEVCWYYFACQSVIQMADLLSISNEVETLIKRRTMISSYFHQKYYKKDGYRSSDFLDDRANGLALLVGLVNKDAYSSVITVLNTVYEATPYMEYYILESLFKNNEFEAGMKRLKDRYHDMAFSDNSTLWEDFHTFGTYNHAWSGGVLTILIKYILGFKVIDTIHNQYSISPTLGHLTYLNVSIPIKDGLLTFDINQQNISIAKPPSCTVKIINVDG